MTRSGNGWKKQERIHNMCEVLDIIEKRGYDQGEEAQARKAALRMYQRGFSAEVIADIVEENIDTIRQWLEEAGQDL